MKRRRQLLQVSTFPFLAVLLCAMGSLILLLLVIDRRAKAVARVKAWQAAARMAKEDSKQAAARRAEWERRRQALHALLAREDGQLVDKIQAAHQDLQTRNQTIRAEEDQTRAVRDRLELAKRNLDRARAELAARRRETANKVAQTEAGRKELRRLTEEVRALEQTVQDLRRLHERDRETYSLIPYRGQRGENRKPIYVECTARALIFHPEHVVLEGKQVMVQDVLAEVARQIDRQSKARPVVLGKKDEAPYLLLLIRPDGIGTYYRFLTAVQGMNFDFGYEFIEPEWVLDFSETGEQSGPQPWMTARHPPVPRSSTPPPSRRSRPLAVPSRLGSQVMGFANQPGGSRSGGSLAATAEVSAGTAASGQTSNAGGTAGPVKTSNAGSTPGGKGVLFGTGSPSPPGSADHVTGLAFGQPATGSPVPSSNGAIGLGGSGPGLLLGRGSPARADAGGNGGGGSGIGIPGSAEARGYQTGGDEPAGLSRRDEPAGSSGLSRRDEPAGSSGLSRRDEPAGSSGSSRGVKGNEPGAAQRSGLGEANWQGANQGANSVLLPERGGVPVPAAGDAGNSGRTSTGNVGDGRSGAEGASKGPSNSSSAVSRSGSSSNSGGSAPGDGTANGDSGTMQSRDAAGQPASGRNRGQQGSGESRSGGSGSGFMGGVRSGKPGPAPVVLRTAPSRDWIIAVECTADLVIVRAARQQYRTSELPTESGVGHPLVQAVRQMIERRQAMLRSGETPYRPIIRFLVQPDGQRSYYLAYPLFEQLGVPMVRQNLEREEARPASAPGR
jgi:hypothetical protein